ncbi:hypothetical protein DFQ27_003701 [Actinomortierella ambigua]|uniref:Uncharacterized protein n=1 Tax=Actinomortierella ambigua TaxID=1343610 RepID=A0A9P6QMV1_9FUNG|nr:hypothetical protein DFQ27_003701 [Actinomortierella ambigua]
MAIGLPIGSRSKKRCLMWSAGIIGLWLLIPYNLVWTDYLSSPAVYSQILNRLDQPVCPTLKPYDRQKLLLLEPIECTPIESKHPDFSVDICFSPYVCNEGLVRVRRRDRTLCKTAELKPLISRNVTHDAFHRQFSGPDAFYVAFSGAEKLAPPDWYHAGHCLYVFPFHISNPGKLSLDITHMYDNYGAVLEQHDRWPDLKLQKVVEAFSLEVCRGCPSRTAAPRSLHSADFVMEKSSPFIATKVVYASGADALKKYGSKNTREYHEVYRDPRDPLAKPDESSGSPSQLPLCSRQFAVQGAWLPAHAEDKNSWRKANYTWTPLGCRYDRPLTRSCLSRRGAKAKKVSFQGDPQLRVLLEHLLRRLNGTAQIQTLTASSLDSLDTMVETTSISYLLDPLMTRKIAPADLLVTNLGQWATGTKYLDQQMTTEKYHSLLLDLIDDFQQTARDTEDLDDEDVEDLLDEGGDEEDSAYATDELEDWEPHRIIGPAPQDDFEDNEYESDYEGDDDTAPADQDRDPPSQDEDERGDGDDNDGFDEVDGSLGGGEDGATPRQGRDGLIHQRVSKSAAPVANDNKSGTLMFQGEKSNRRPGTDKPPRKQKQPSQQDTAPLSQPSKKEQQQQQRGQEGQNKPYVSPPKAEGSNSRSPQRGSEDSPSPSSPATLNQSRPSRQNKINSSLSSPSSPSDASSVSRSKEATRIRLSKRSLGQGGENGNIRTMKSKRAEPRIERTATKLVWAGMVAYPETQPVDSLHVHDWRSIYRLRYWNQVAEEVMMLNGVPFMDFFPMTLSMVDTSPDRSHYHGTDAIEAMLEELQYKLGLCAEEEGF